MSEIVLTISGRPVGKWLSPAAVARFWSKVDIGTSDQCWPWTAGKFRGGYGQFKVAGRTFVATRYVVLATTGVEVPADRFVCHHCDNPPCVNPAHLFVADAAANNADMAQKGRHRAPARGEGSGRKLTWEDVAEIRRAYSALPVSQRALAKQYGVGQMTISRIVRGEAW